MILAIRRFGQNRFLCSEDGASVVEFAIAVPAFLLFVVGLIEVARGVWTVNALQNAVAHTARYASVNSASKPTASNCTGGTIAAYQASIKAYLDAELAAVLPSSSSAVTAPTCPTGSLPAVTLTITATYVYNFALGTLVPLTPITVVQQATVTTPLT